MPKTTTRLTNGLGFLPLFSVLLCHVSFGFWNNFLYVLLIEVILLECFAVFLYGLKFWEMTRDTGCDSEVQNRKGKIEVEGKNYCHTNFYYQFSSFFYYSLIAIYIISDLSAYIECDLYFPVCNIFV